jgi:3-carboxy-cis,cis-muconate cycloisomerase
MPQKRNPVGSALAVACARQVHAQASVLTAALPQEHERALGAWQSEWPALRNALAYAGGAAEGARRALDGLEIDTERMRANLELTYGLVMAEKASFQLARELGRREAQQRVAEAAAGPRPLAEELGLDAADLDPAGYLGSAETFVDRALAAYREELS